MKALSVRAPWAWLIATGRKRFELRSQRTHYRGPLLICAGLRASDWPALVTPDELAAALAAPRGVALCIVDVIDCRPATADDAEGACCAPEEGEWVWVLANARPVVEQPVRGKQGFFSVEGVVPA